MARLINKTQGFTIVNNTILKDKKISLKARGLMVSLLSLPDGWEFSVRGLSTILPDGRDAITAACKELENNGYLQRVRSKNENGQWAGYDWIINDTPAEKPVTGNPSTDKPSTDKPFTENPNQLNNQLLNTKLLNTNESIIHSFPHYPKFEDPDMERRTERWRNDLKKLVGFEMIKDDPIAVNIFDIAVEVCATDTDMIKISKGNMVPQITFANRIQNLYFEDYIKIADQIRSIEEPIKNPKAYILAALYNETTISSTYWTNKVKTDGAI